MKSPMLIRCLSIGFLLLIWVVISMWIDDPNMLPKPWQVASDMGHEIAKGKMQKHLLATGLRVIYAFTLAMFLGGILGYIMGKSSALNRWLDPWLIIFLNLPALIIIVLCYLWIGLNETAAILAVTLNKIPLVASIIREGARAQNPELHDLAQVFNIPHFRKLLHITLPELLPFIISAARAGLSVIWKIVLVVEFLGRSSGIGFQIHLHFQQFNISMVMAYALSFVFCILALEFAIFQPIEKRVSQWRTP